MTESVAWGVTSRGVRPVPPVVTMSPWRRAASRNAASIPARSSGTTSRSTLNPRAASRSATADPLSSSRTPAALPSLAVRTRALRVAPLAAPLVDNPPGCPLARAMLRRRGGFSAIAGAVPVAAPPAGLQDELDRADLDSAFDALDHVVDRQRGHRSRRQGLHLYTGRAGRRRLGPDPEDARAPIRRHRDDEVGQREGMAERNQFARPLATHDTGQLGYAEDVALRPAAVDHQAPR